MGSSWSSSSGTSKSEALGWTGKVYFDPESDKKNSKIIPINDSELKTRLKECIDPKEEIRNIWIYKEQLTPGPQSTTLLEEVLLFHAFIVLETNSWYWSIEKNNEGITIQRSKELYYVNRWYRDRERKGVPQEWEHDTGRMKMGDFVDWLYHEDELNKPYHVTNANCQHFGKAVFNHFAKTKIKNFNF